jgi:molecular chaperone GrpE
VQQRPKRQVDDDQVNNDTSRAPEPENLTGAQAEVDPKPGATKTEAADPAATGGKAHAEPSAPEKRGQAAGDQASDSRATGTDGSDPDAEGSTEATREPAEAATAADPAAGSKEAEAAADAAQPATPADDDVDAGGKPADGAGDQRTDAADVPGDAEAEANEPEAAAARTAEDEVDDQADEPEAAAMDEVEADEPEAAAAEEEPSEAVLAELVSARAEADGYLDDLRRLQAEFDNYRKRTMREQTARMASASQALVSRLLPVLDNFELAVSHAEQSRDFDRMLKGVEMVFGELNDLLAGEGLVAIEASGKPFDPERHEAVVAVEEEGVEAGTVVDVIRKGYELNGRVLRPAMVKVAR